MTTKNPEPRREDGETFEWQEQSPFDRFTNPVLGVIMLCATGRLLVRPESSSRVGYVEAHRARELARRVLGPYAEDSLSEWVLTSERLPRRLGEFMLVFAPARGVDMAAWDGRVWIWRSSGYAIESEVTHWRPLPLGPARDL